MTRDETDADIPVGRVREEDLDADRVVADAAASADEQALADAGLPQEGTSEATHVPERKVGLGHRLYNGEAGLDVVGKSKLIYKITAVVLLICIASMVFRGFNFGIDFAGGNSFRLPGTTEQLEILEVRYERIPVEPFREPPGAEAAPKTRPGTGG